MLMIHRMIVGVAILSATFFLVGCEAKTIDAAPMLIELVDVDSAIAYIPWCEGKRLNVGVLDIERSGGKLFAETPGVAESDGYATLSLEVDRILAGDLGGSLVTYDYSPFLASANSLDDFKYLVYRNEYHRQWSFLFENLILLAPGLYIREEAQWMPVTEDEFHEQIERGPLCVYE